MRVQSSSQCFLKTKFLSQCQQHLEKSMLKNTFFVIQCTHMYCEFYTIRQDKIDGTSLVSIRNSKGEWFMLTTLSFMFILKEIFHYSMHKFVCNKRRGNKAES